MVALASNTSETSSWDILEGFPKPLSRARETKTRPCTEAATCKSLNRVEIRQVIYDSRIRLESFSRDPIGFEGSGSNLYEYVEGSPLDRADPTGEAWIDWPWNWIWPPKQPPLPAPPGWTPEVKPPKTLGPEGKAIKLVDEVTKKFGSQCMQCALLEKMLADCEGQKQCTEVVLLAMDKLKCK